VGVGFEAGTGAELPNLTNHEEPMLWNDHFHCEASRNIAKLKGKCNLRAIFLIFCFSCATKDIAFSANSINKLLRLFQALNLNSPTISFANFCLNYSNLVIFRATSVPLHWCAHYDHLGYCVECFSFGELILFNVYQWLRRRLSVEEWTSKVNLVLCLIKHYAT